MSQWRHTVCEMTTQTEFTGHPSFRVLGPVELLRGGREVALGGSTALSLLAGLLVSANQVVAAEELMDLIWGTAGPAHPQAALQSTVSRLRRVVGADVVETLGRGYRICAGPGDLDLLQFDDLVASADADATRGASAAAVTSLEEALGLWREPVLGNVGSNVLRRDVAPKLTERYLDAHEQRAELCLRLGQHQALTGELAGLVRAHPFRERLAGSLMVALYRSDRQADALAVYEGLRQSLAEELGVDPAPAVQELHLQILRADPEVRAPHPQTGHPVQLVTETDPDLIAARPGEVIAAPPRDVPRQLPTSTRAFTGRQAELDELLRVVEAASDTHGPGTVVISAIDGMAGIGKTALAVHAAHRLAGRYGDGQLFIDLHGYTLGYPPRTADQALETFLRTLGVPPRQIPADVEERAALYRERLAGTQTMIVLDNAADESQVRPLIPGDGGCLVLVTSRRKLKALDDAHTLALDVLPEQDAIALFCAVAGPGRVAADDPAVTEIIGLCGCLPLAVRIAAALIRSRPAWSPGRLAARLRAARARLDALFDGDRDLAALFDLSSKALHDDQRRLYRYLGVIPGPEIDACATSALLNTDLAEAERLLQELVDHNLLLEPAAGRYRMHDLIRAQVRALVAAEPAGERQAALDRLLDYYQYTAGLADARIARYGRRGPAGPAPAHAPALPDADAARAWLRAERANLIACLRYAIQGGRDERIVALSAGLASLLRTDGPWLQATAPHAAAAAAAARLGDRSGQAHALTELGNLRRLTSDYLGADRSLEAAMELYREADDKSGQARALTELAIIRRVSSDYQGAERRLQAALELYREAADKSGQARALTELGIVRYVFGNYPGAQRSLQAALELYREADDKSGQARALTELAEIQQLTGDYEGAARNAEASVAISEGLGDRLGRANALTVLGRTRRLTGDYGDAVRHQEAALDMYRELGDRLGHANARTHLAEVRRLTGDYEAAARDLEESISTYRDLGNRGNQASALHCYAAVISAAGDLPRATDLYRDALQLAREVQQPDDEAAALQGLGESCLRAGQLQDGAGYLYQALEIYQQLGMPTPQEVTTCLAEIEALLLTQG
jgi:DNA-binding SARP family transcriptional activator/tetratricopeptide (TPR) repeat protein